MNRNEYFREWISQRRFVSDLGNHVPDEDLKGREGYVYPGQLYIESDGRSNHCLTIGNWSKTGYLHVLEQELFDFGLEEGMFFGEEN